MNKKYAFHPKDFEIGETEKFYSDMAAKGWSLVKRGAYLSRFEKAKPQKMRYRIEVISAKALEGLRLPEELVSVYKDCGWEYVDGKSFIHVFRAPEGSGAMEFYMQPEQQAETMKGLRKHYLISMLSRPFNIVLILLLGLLVDGIGEGKWLAQAYRVLVEQTDLTMIFVVFLIWTLAGSIRAAWRMNRLYHTMKKGIPLDHAPKTKRIALKIGNGIAVALLIGLSVYGISNYEKSPMPTKTDEPYLLLNELGISGERILNFVNHNESTVIYNRSWIAECWDCCEFLETETGDDWMYQNVYRFESEAFVDSFVAALMKEATFASSKNPYVEISLEGLDRVWMADRLECIAVKGNLVCSITYPYEYKQEGLQVLQAVADKWEDIE